MVVKLQHGGSFSTTETQTISITIVDEINQPNYLEAEIVSPAGNRETTYAPGALVRVIEDDAAGDPVIFQGRVDKISAPVHPTFGQIVRIQARDNLAELAYITMKDGTYSANGTDALINTIIRAHAKTIGATGIDLPAVDSNDADFTTSLRTSGRTYIAKNDSKSVLEVITHLADSDPWHANYASTENYGYAFWLDTDNDFHYHQLGTWPTTTPISSGLSVIYGLSADTDTRRIMRNPGAWDDSADEAVGEVNVTYTGKIEGADSGVTKTLRLKRLTHGTVGGSGYPFRANDIIYGATSGSYAKIQLVTSGALLVSHIEEGDNAVPNFTPGETIYDIATENRQSSPDGVFKFYRRSHLDPDGPSGTGPNHPDPPFEIDGSEPAGLSVAAALAAGKIGTSQDEVGHPAANPPYKYSVADNETDIDGAGNGHGDDAFLTYAGASATFTTTPDLEDVQTAVAYIRPQEYQSFDLPDISARSGVSEVADYYARRGFIDVSADAFVKGTVQIAGYPTYMYTGSVHVPVRAGEHIYISNTATTTVAANYHVSRIVFRQNITDGSYGSTIYVTNDNGNNWKKTLHEVNKELAKDASISAVDATGRGQVSLLDTATSSGYVPTESYGTFRYSLDGGGGSADTLGFVSGQTSDTPAAATSGSAFWTMLNEVNTGTTPDGSSLIFEPIVDYGGTSNVMNRAFIGYHNPLFATYSYYLNGGDGTAAFPSHTFWSDVNTGMYLNSADNIGFSLGGTMRFGMTTSTFYPGVTNSYDLGYNDGNGGTDFDFRNIYSVNALSVSSDRRLKEDIQPTNLGLSFVNDLTPVSYKWKEKHDDVMDQRHYGLIAQDVVGVLKNHGIDSLEDFGGILHNGNEEQMYKAKYEHFIPILIKAVQELSTEVKELKEKN